jgi:arylsulfatase A-like enzyme
MYVSLSVVLPVSLADAQEKATRNTLFWRVPGQAATSQGRNNRIVEMLDFFPTAIDLVGLPKISKCTGIDQPPTVLCLQGESYATEFMPALSAPVDTPAPKQYAFSQWPYRASKINKYFRMGYTVRSKAGFRLTQYVPYDLKTHSGTWADILGKDDLELYNYNTDPDERVNQAANPEYAGVVKELQAVLKNKYVPS